MRWTRHDLTRPEEKDSSEKKEAAQGQRQVLMVRAANQRLCARRQPSAREFRSASKQSHSASSTELNQTDVSTDNSILRSR